MNEYGRLFKRLCGHAVQLPEVVPVRVHADVPEHFRHGELSLWSDGSRAWAEFGGRQSLVTACEVIELLAVATDTCQLEVGR